MIAEIRPNVDVVRDLRFSVLLALSPATVKCFNGLEGATARIVALLYELNPTVLDVEREDRREFPRPRLARD